MTYNYRNLLIRLTNKMSIEQNLGKTFIEE